MSTPCEWEVDHSCCSSWDEYDAAVQQRADEYASLVLWASTGRRFGLCQVTVRPCGRRKGDKMPPWGWGSVLHGGVWWPYLGPDGAWRNCGCRNFCNCTPRCEAYLPGPVDEVLEVVVEGETVDATAYEVQDGHWLVRVDGDCWPHCPDMASNEAFEVTYVRGEAVPAQLSTAAGILACEFAKACAGADCRLPGRLQFIARQGVTAQMVDLDRLMDRGLTGLTEVDQVIAAFNPHGLKERPQVYSPDRPRPRQVTVPRAGS